MKRHLLPLLSILFPVPCSLFPITLTLSAKALPTRRPISDRRIPLYSVNSTRLRWRINSLPNLISMAGTFGTPSYLSRAHVFQS